MIIQYVDKPLNAQGFFLPGMSPRSCRPSADPVVGADQVVAREHSIVAVRPSLNQLAVDESAAVPAAVVCTQGFTERAARRAEERRGEWARRALGEQSDAGLEAVWQLRRRECRDVGGVIAAGVGDVGERRRRRGEEALDLEAGGGAGAGDPSRVGGVGGERRAVREQGATDLMRDGSRW